MSFSQKLTSVLPFWIICGVVTWLVSENAFFWDTVQLASKQAHWYYENNFQSFFLPENIDSGHPPSFGILIAFCWQFFGKTLTVSHFIMLPFLIGIVWQLQEFALKIAPKNKAKWLILLVFIDPFFAGQAVLVSPDIVLIFFFLLSLNSILNTRKWLLSLGILGLGLISLRGMMVGFSLYLWWCIMPFLDKEEIAFTFNDFSTTFLKKLFPFLPGGIVALAYLGLHYYKVGWIGYHPNSPWAGSFETVHFYDFLKNIGLLGWRLADYGRLFLGIILIGLLRKNSHHIFRSTRTVERSLVSTNVMISLPIIIGLVLTLSLLLHKGLLGHRYLLPITLSISFLFYHLCFQNKKKAKFLYSIAFVGLLTGNLWIYPKHIAQGWDATLAHLPHYTLRKKMIAFIDQEGINYADIGTTFPNIGAFEVYDLNDRKVGFTKKDFSKNKYFFYTSVINALSDKELQLLEENWVVIQDYNTFGLSAFLYKKN